MTAATVTATATAITTAITYLVSGEAQLQLVPTMTLPDASC